MPRQDSTRLSLAEFARRVGADLTAIRAAVASGRLTSSSLARDSRTGHVYIVNVASALEEWTLNRQRDHPTGNDSQDIPTLSLIQKPVLTIHSPGKMSTNGSTPTSAYARARLRELEASASLKEIERDKKAGKLIDKLAVERELSARMAKLRSNIMAVPSRLRQRCPDIDKEVFEVVSGLLREVLDDHSRAGASGRVLVEAEADADA